MQHIAINAPMMIVDNHYHNQIEKNSFNKVDGRKLDPWCVLDPSFGLQLLEGDMSLHVTNTACVRSDSRFNMMINNRRGVINRAHV
jgi:hypothetical protein